MDLGGREGLLSWLRAPAFRGLGTGRLDTGRQPWVLLLGACCLTWSSRRFGKNTFLRNCREGSSGGRGGHCLATPLSPAQLSRLAQSPILRLRKPDEKTQGLSSEWGGWLISTCSLPPPPSALSPGLLQGPQPLLSGPATQPGQLQLPPEAWLGWESVLQTQGGRDAAAQPHTDLWPHHRLGHR